MRVGKPGGKDWEDPTTVSSMDPSKRYLHVSARKYEIGYFTFASPEDSYIPRPALMQFMSLALAKDVRQFKRCLPALHVTGSLHTLR